MFTAATASVVAPYLGTLVQLRGNAGAGQFVSNIRFVGLTFSHADWSLPAAGHAAQASFDVPAAVAGAGARSCTVQKALFIHLGGYAVEFAQGSQDNVVVGIQIFHEGGAHVLTTTNRWHMEENGRPGRSRLDWGVPAQRRICTRRIPGTGSTPRSRFG